MNKNIPYEPSDDTFLLAECARKFRGGSALEIAAGTGYISNLLKEKFAKVVATDIDPKSLRMGRKNVMRVCCEGASALTNIRFDLIVINPPYLPSNGIHDVAVDGGANGIEVTLKMLESVVYLLKTAGTLLLVTSSIANYGELLKYLKKHRYRVDILARKRIQFEELLVVQGKPHSE